MNKLITTLTTIGAAMILTACVSTDGARRLALPLDHGPRAQTTPWENKQRSLRIVQGAKAEENAAGSSRDPKR